MPALHHNHPEVEERTTPTNRVSRISPYTPPPAPPAPEPDPEPEPQTTKSRLIAFKAANPNYSNNKIATAIGSSSSYVSQYLTKPASAFPGDLEKFELLLLDFLRGIDLKYNFEFPVIKTDVSNAVHAFADYVRSAGSIGVIYGDAGLGKSVGLSLAAAESKTGILITANANQRDAKGITQLLWAQLTSGNKHTNRSRWSHIVSVLKDTNRLIIVDSAQRLIGEGRHALCDLLDQTGCPILLAGNPCILSRLASDDQQYSRTLPALEVQLKNPEPVVAHILKCLIPEHAEDLLDSALEVARRKGHLRQMVNTIKATLALSATPDFANKPIQTAWASARALSVDTKTAA